MQSIRNIYRFWLDIFKSLLLMYHLIGGGFEILTIVLTDGPYISEYAEIAYKLADAALKQYHVNIFLYLDAVHIPKRIRIRRSLPMQVSFFPDLRGKEL